MVQRMERSRVCPMSKGAILFAFNSPKFNYYNMAVATAKRINHFLNLPVTLITDEESLPINQLYTFDNIVVTNADKNNIRDHSIWINKFYHLDFSFK